jgi:hypothetical protein
MLVAPAWAETLPSTWPSMRRPSPNKMFPVMTVSGAIRLLMGGCFFLPNMG